MASPRGSDLEAQSLLGKPAVAQVTHFTITLWFNWQLWRAVTPLFLHASALHLVFNLLFILHIGLRMEERYGMKKFLALYFFSSVVGNLFSMMMQPRALSVGASTAGFGIIGGMAAEVCVIWRKLSEDVKQIYSVDIVIFAILIFFVSFGHTAYRSTVLLRWFPVLYYGSAAACAAILLVSPLFLLMQSPYRVVSPV
ncbi:rhomboid protease ROM3 [Besnoitia besnoiti]|uniref:Rhomboid-like protease n=1 Tax=Besnoitia besnoiti TaxID=94643 RepID=A0A2A9MLG5_BESBE|nr:rhomboid protease ROM3 [Besnoitia besnoiti]PFH36533.1 rhomboid protease ROM3 [Besnoitia besnoiti]